MRQCGICDLNTTLAAVGAQLHR